MKLVTVSQAKSQLSAYIKSAEAGEQIVIMRGSKPAVILRPISEDELSAVPEIPVSALAEFDAEIEQDRKAGRLGKLGNTPEEAVSTLKRLGRKLR
ncbi:MAG: type II toxin-antitoxin system Phd/YefM family antitoxin [Methylacidiphilales bacterium]|nr:type II toxin-antitoxin system Phd/YefM family antitoxin [Candidatus Methylacidiphilales bacterium]